MKAGAVVMRWLRWSAPVLIRFHNRSRCRIWDYATSVFFLKVGIYGYTAYSASKFGVRGLGAWLRLCNRWSLQMISISPSYSLPTPKLLVWNKKTSCAQS